MNARHRKISVATVVFVALFAGMMSLALSHAGEGPFQGPDNWTLTITGAMEQDVSIPIEALYNGTYETITSDYHFLNQWGTSFTFTFTGVRLVDLLERTSVALNESTGSVRFGSIDGYITESIPLESIYDDPDGVIIAFKQDGEWIPSKAQGGEGPLRVVVGREVIGDGANSIYWAKYATTVIVTMI